MANQIYVDPSITAAVIQVVGVCYYRVGPASVAPQVFSVDATFSTCDQCQSSSSSSSSSSGGSSSSSSSQTCGDCSDCPNTLTTVVGSGASCVPAGTGGFIKAGPDSVCDYAGGLGVRDASSFIVCEIIDGERYWFITLGEGAPGTISPNYLIGACPSGVITFTCDDDGSSTTITIGT